LCSVKYDNDSLDCYNMTTLLGNVSHFGQLRWPASNWTKHQRNWKFDTLAFVIKPAYLTAGQDVMIGQGLHFNRWDGGLVLKADYNIYIDLIAISW